LSIRRANFVDAGLCLLWEEPLRRLP